MQLLRTALLTVLATVLPACVVGDESDPTPADLATIESGGCTWDTVHTFANIDDYVAYEPAKACKEITGIPVARPLEGPGGIVAMQCCFRDAPLAE